MTLEAKWWELTTKTDARCFLCFHHCRISLKKAGYCGVRLFDGSKVISPYLGKFCSFAIDPIEKKPLYHWRPGTFILSLGSIGCNMRCPFCQNYGISQPTHPPQMTTITPSNLLALAKEHNQTAVAFTYNEPTLQAEYILAAAPLLAEHGIATVLVTNGMISQVALEKLLPWVDAANIDVKTFNPKAYAQLGGSLKKVQETIESFAKAQKHIELTCLVVPGISDNKKDLERMADWIASISPDIPLHLSRYFPQYKYTAPATDIELLKNFAAKAATKLKHVYIGNVRL